MNPNKKPVLTRQNATTNLNKGAGAHLTRQDATRDLKVDAAPQLTRQNATRDVMRNTDAGKAGKNSMLPAQGPRATEKSNAPPMKNSPRKGNKALDSIGSNASKRIATAIQEGPGKMHKDSTKRLHKERAFIYDQSKRGKTMQNMNINKPSLSISMKGINKDTISRKDKIALTEEARGLKGYQKQIKEKNPEAAKREKIGGYAKKTKKGAKLADYTGTAVAFANPAAGAAIKVGAKATKIAAGAAATGAYHLAAKSYAKNVDEKASGDAMFDSHIAREKADMMKNTRNKMAVSTGMSIVGAGLSAGLDAALEDAGENVANKVTAGYDLAKRQVKEQVKKPLKEKIRENKSELVNLMQIQKSRADYAKRQEAMKATVKKN